MATSDDLRDYSRLLYSTWAGTVTAAMVFLGDRLGLYRALADAGAPVTSDELATAAGADERWVREWLHNQAAAGLVAWEGERFWLTEAGVAVLADPASPAYAVGTFQRLPGTIGLLDRLEESFRTGIGLPYDALGPGDGHGIEGAFAPWFRSALVPQALPALDGAVERLRAGAVVADVGCGAGVAVVELAKAFPATQVRGYDISERALERAEQNRREAGVTNASFHDPRTEPLPADGSVDLVTAFDCLHDMTRPQETIAAVRAALRDDGWWLVADIKARDSFAQNVEKNPMAAMMYGISVLTCMSSALSEPGGAGLGTLGLPESRLREMTAAAGFSRFRRLDLDHPVNAFYEVRP